MYVSSLNKGMDLYVQPSAYHLCVLKVSCVILGLDPPPPHYPYQCWGGGGRCSRNGCFYHSDCGFRKHQRSQYIICTKMQLIIMFMPISMQRVVPCVTQVSCSDFHVCHIQTYLETYSLSCIGMYRHERHA